MKVIPNNLTTRSLVEQRYILCLTKLLQVSYENTKQRTVQSEASSVVRDTYQEVAKPRLQGQSCIDQKVICGARRAQYIC